MSSSSLTTVTTVLTGANYCEWHVSMHAYLQSTGTWWTICEARPVADAETWDGDNEKAMGTITLRCTAPIKIQVAERRPLNRSGIYSKSHTVNRPWALPTLSSRSSWRLPFRRTPILLLPCDRSQPTLLISRKPGLRFHSPCRL